MVDLIHRNFTHTTQNSPSLLNSIASTLQAEPVKRAGDAKHLLTASHPNTLAATLLAAMPPTRLPSEIAQALLRGATVLTASARAARWLEQAYAEDARASGRRGWQRPAILDWSTWTGQLYACLAREGIGLPLVLTGLQEELLWKRVQARDAAAVVSPERLAQLACSAYALLSAYNAHGSRRTGGAAGLWTDAHEDADRFLGWAEAFDRVCTQLDVISCSRVEGELQRHAAELQQRAAALPHHAELLLVGFDRLTPAQLTLTQTLETGGCRVSQLAIAEPAAEQQLHCSVDEQTELQTCALWVRGQLKAASTEGTARRIGVLLPELAGARAAVDRAFSRVLLPQSARMAADSPSPYEFSLGVPLATVPLVHAALLLLRWLARPLPAAELTGLLLGGFLAVNAAEHLALAQSDAALRRSGLLTTEIKLGTLLRHVRRQGGLLPQAFTRRLADAEQWVAREAPGGRGRRRSFAVWAEAVPTLLEGLGWPGFQTLGSTHYQARASWERLLADAALLGFAGDAVTWAEFVRELAGFAHGRLFAAGSQDAPVQVMGITEAAGQNFDAVWLLQMTEDRWPRGGRMHPLLPAALQRDAAMPHTTAEGDLALAELQMRRVVASAPLVAASYASQSSGVDARPSPLLSLLTASASAASEAPAKLPVPACETVREPDTTTVALWPAERIAGGSEILKRQAACGFQSFAAKRLRAVALDDEAWGLDAGERATLLHRALEQLWSDTPVAPGEEGEARLHTQDNLLRAIDSGAIDGLLEAAIVRSFTGTMREAEGDNWRTEYLQLEQRRLFTRLRRWLDVEADRAAFRVVAVERKLEGVTVGPLRLNLRLDRADEVGEAGNDRTLLLDYKTAGTVNTKLWSGARPDEPQLPIYALFGAPFGGLAHVAGIAFAQIRAGDGKTRLHALAENPEELLGGSERKEGTPDKRLLTPETRDEWADALLALAEAFVHGEAPVNPKHGAETCRLCGLYGLCRVRSQALEITALPMEEDSDA